MISLNAIVQLELSSCDTYKREINAVKVFYRLEICKIKLHVQSNFIAFITNCISSDDLYL